MKEKNQINVGLINTGLDETSPPMNLVYLATALKLNGNAKVRILDDTFKPGSTLKQVKNFNFLGISAITRYYKIACKIANHIKNSISIPVVIGGVHISTIPESLSKDFTLGVIGEGDNILPELCDSFYKTGSFKINELQRIPGLVYRNGDKLIKSSANKLIEPLDNIPVPDFNFLDERYFKRQWINWTETMGRVMHLTSARGCTYNCVFCATKRFWKTTRFHSARRIMTEVKELVLNWGVDHLVFDDDLFLNNKKRLKEFTDLMEEEDLTGKVAFSCNARSNLLDEDMCRILKRIGVKSLNFGFESGSDKILQYLKGENITVDHHKKAIALCHEYGFKVYGSLIFGSPGETIDDMNKTLEFIDYTIKNKCHKIWAFVMTPLPGTPLWDQAKQQGKVSNDMDWEQLDLNSCDNPIMLEPDIILSDFQNIFNSATAKLDKAWLGNKWLRTIIMEHRRAMRKISDNPKRALSIFRNVLLK
jgi:anaerobic magnesium-protoporphyrin IX monomethyl ester cyclase